MDSTNAKVASETMARALLKDANSEQRMLSAATDLTNRSAWKGCSGKPVPLCGALDMSTPSSRERRLKGDHWATAGSTGSNATTGTAPTSASMPRLSIRLNLFSPYSKRDFLPAPREGDGQSSKNL
jgi:hypothetical protein